MTEGCPFEISSHQRSIINLHVQRMIEKFTPELPESQEDKDKRRDDWRLGLSGEFAVATLLGQTYDFQELPEGDGGVDLWNCNVSIDVKTSRAARIGSPVTAWPTAYRSKVMVYVRQETKDRWDRFNVLGWAFADQVKRMAAGKEEVSICLCQLHPVHHGFPPDVTIGDLYDPDLGEKCDWCGRAL